MSEDNRDEKSAVQRYEDAIDLWHKGKENRSKPDAMKLLLSAAQEGHEEAILSLYHFAKTAQDEIDSNRMFSEENRAVARYLDDAIDLIREYEIDVDGVSLDETDEYDDLSF